MEEVLRIGPMALPLAPLQLFAAWWLGDALAQRRAARSQQIWGWHGWLLLVCGLLAARAAFVLEFAPHYAQPAWAAFDIRDGGWTASVGTIAVLLYGATLWLRRHPLAPAAMVGIAGALALWLGAQGLRQAMAPGQAPLPTFSAVALDARTVQLDQLAQQQGQPLVINLWATWCPPCRREMPMMAEIAAQETAVDLHFINQGADANAKNDQGYMTSVAFSPSLGHSIGLGYLKNGSARKGETLRAVNPLAGEEVMVKVVSAHFVDPEGERLRG